MRIVRLIPGIVRVATVASCLAVASPAFAQGSPAPSPSTAAFEIINLPPVDLRDLATQPPVNSAPPQSPFPARQGDKPRRPGALLPLYGSLIALQGLDIHSTRRAIASGSARESNPALRDVVHNGAAFVAVKAGATAGVIWASEKMWKKNRKGAVVFASLVNVAMAAIVANNYRIAR